MSEQTQDPKDVNETPDQAAEQADNQATPPQAEEAGKPEEAKVVPDYPVQVEDAGMLKKKVTVTVPEAVIAAKREEMFGELDTTAQVPGFRLGHAPRRLLEKRFGREVSRDVRNALLGESLGAAMKKSDLHVLGEPDLDLEGIELPDAGDMQYHFEVEVAPEFTLPELDGIPIRKPVLVIDDARIDQAIDRMRQGKATYEASQEPTAAQDVVDADARIYGEGIEEMKTDVVLRVAPGQVEGLPMVDLGEKLAGLTVGQTATLTVKVPPVHPNEAWRGKEAKIELTIKAIRRRQLPEVNEEFAKATGYDTVPELRQALAGRMKAQLETEVHQAMRVQINQYLLDHTQVELPEGMAARFAERMLRRRFVELLQRGIPREQIEERMTELAAAVAEESKRDLKVAFVLQRIADDRGLEVSDEEINAQVAQMAHAYNRRPERLRMELEEDGSLQQVATAIIEDKAADILLKTAKITEVTPEMLAEEERQRLEAEEAAALKAAEQAAAAPAVLDAPAEGAAPEAAKADEAGKEQA
jgi:trigger factor